MIDQCPCQKSDDSSSNSGFIFGLICGAIIGAIVAIIIYKNNKSEVFKNLEEKIKNFFGNFIKTETDITKNTPKKSKKIISPKIIASSTISSPRPKKPTPRNFIKPKK